jgi:hypothetical protein
MRSIHPHPEPLLFDNWRVIVSLACFLGYLTNLVISSIIQNIQNILNICINQKEGMANEK